jgi:hypothetical protein
LTFLWQWYESIAYDNTIIAASISQIFSQSYIYHRKQFDQESEYGVKQNLRGRDEGDYAMDSEFKYDVFLSD